MSYKLLITPDAETQLDEAVLYYKNRASKRVALDFLSEFKNSCQSILNVIHFQFFFDEFRAVPMRKFPFLLFYTIDENQKVIIIKAVFHTSQNPDKYPN